CISSRPAHTIFDSHMHCAKALLHMTVAVFCLDVSGLCACLDPGAVQRIRHVVAIVRGQWSGRAPILVATELVALSPPEIRQTVAIAPASRTQFLPFVEVVSVAANVN